MSESHHSLSDSEPDQSDRDEIEDDSIATLAPTKESNIFFASLADFGVSSSDPDLADDFYKVINAIQVKPELSDQLRQQQLSFDPSTTVTRIRENSRNATSPVVKPLLLLSARQHSDLQCSQALLGISHACDNPYPCPIQAIAKLMEKPRDLRTPLTSRKFFEMLLTDYMQITLNCDNPGDQFFLFATCIKSTTARKAILSSDDTASVKTTSSKSSKRKHRKHASSSSSFFGRRKS
jgi:hypothetical protein